MNHLPTPDRVAGGGVEVDLRQMPLPADLDTRYGPQLDAAVAEMEALERGERVNASEDRQVGHYWLRNPDLAPTDDRAAIQQALAEVRAFADRQFGDPPRFGNVLWIGIGGSGLGPQMLYDALRTPGRKPRFHFFDNTDPAGFQRTLEDIQHAGGLSDTLTVVVSKSGGTKETRNGMLVAEGAYARQQLSFAEHAVAVTGRGSQLDKLAAGEPAGDAGTPPRPWLARFPMWDWVGGRTSLFSAVGTLPAALLACDVDALLAGARGMDDATRSRRLAENPALLLAAAWHYAVESLGLANMVVLPYCDQLGLLGKYLQQLVMESLGKRGQGITVYGNKGSTDQHSFVQQLRDGRADFFANFVSVLVPRHDWEVEEGVTAGDYLAAFQMGTERALAAAGRPSLRITIERLDARSLAALVALFERAVGYYAAMLGINAYDQPGVEAGKRAADEVLELQRRLIQLLAASRGTACAVPELATQTGSDEQQVFDILDRLARCGRAGLRPTGEAGATSFLME